MIYLLVYILASLLLLGLTLGFYVAACKIREMPEEIAVLPMEVRLICSVIVFTGRNLSMLSNWLVFTVLLLELPKERFLTTRLMRHRRHSKGWRRTVGIYFCNNWLTPFHKAHCNEK